MQFLAHRGLRVPEQVSLVCTDYDITLAWCQTSIAHMRWDNARNIRRIVRWVADLRTGRADRKIINYPAEFIDGASVGRAPSVTRKPQGFCLAPWRKADWSRACGWRVEITGAVKTGPNELEIEVINLWPNRRIGDASLPEEPLPLPRS